MSLRIAAATAADAPSIADFNIRMARETENIDLDPVTVGAGVRALIEQPAMGHYTLAWHGDARAGSAMISYEWSDWRNGLMWWIQSVYVAPDYRRQGVFRALYQHLEDRARNTENCCGLRLYVERDNHNAQTTYRAMGMHETHYRLYEQLFD